MVRGVCQAVVKYGHAVGVFLDSPPGYVARAYLPSVWAISWACTIQLWRAQRDLHLLYGQDR